MVRLARKGWLVVVLSLCCLLAGCSATPFGSTPDPTAAPTPAPVPTDAPTTVTPERLGPGLSAAGIDDTDRLLNEHRDTLTVTAYRTTRYDRVRFANGTVRSNVTITARFDPDEKRFLVSRTIRGVAPERAGATTVVEQFGIGDRIYQRRVVQTEPRYSLLFEMTGTSPPRTALLPEPTIDRTLLFSLRAFETRVVDHEQRAESTLVRYRLEDTGVASRSRLRELTGPSAENVSFTVTVGSDGVVYAYLLSYETTVDGDPVTVVRGGTVSGIGTTTVTEPTWVDEARVDTSRSGSSSE